jgi:hypothetical protein
MLFVEKQHSLDVKKKLYSHKFWQNKTHNHKLNLNAIKEETSLALAKSW